VVAPPRGQTTNTDRFVRLQQRGGGVIDEHTNDVFPVVGVGASAGGLEAVRKLLESQKRIEQAMPILEFVSQKGDAQAKEGAATILLNGALPFLQPPQDFDRAATMLRQVTTWADPKGKVFQIANYYLGLSILQQIAKIDPEAEKQKSCDLATKEQSMAAEADRAFKASGAYKPDDVAKFQKYLDGLRPRTASMLKAYCK